MNRKIIFRIIDKIVLFILIFNVVYIHKINEDMYKVNIEKTYEGVKSRITETNEIQNGLLNIYFLEKQRELELLVSYPQIYNMDKEEQEKFLSEKQWKLGLKDIFVIPNETEHKTRYIQNRDFVENALVNESIIKPIYCKNYKVAIGITASIYKNDKKVGALCGFINILEIRNMLQQNITKTEDVGYVIDKDSILMRISRYKNQQDTTFRKIYETTLNKEIEKAIKNKTNIITQFTDNKGEVYLLNGIYNERMDWMTIKVTNCKHLEENVYRYKKYVNLELFFIVISLFAILYTACRNKKNIKDIKTDNLTKIRNRVAFNLETVFFQKRNYALIYLDLNKFKKINDIYGHKKGDEALIIYSNILTNVFKKVGHIYRMGGDEFVVVMTQQIEIAEEYCKKINEELNKIDINIDWKLSTSYGIAYGDKSINVNKVIEKADQKMYAQKTKNKH